MKRKDFTRRKFITTVSAGTAAAVVLSAIPTFGIITTANTPAIMGGQRLRTKGWPGWPIWNPATDEEQVLKVLRSGVWSRAGVVTEFEKKWAETIGAKH